jgi:membrane associated rhomboid family serine protease
MTPSPFAILVALTYAGALVVALYLGDGDRWRGQLTDRLYYGVPWGTLVTVTFVLAVYLFVQGGLSNWHDPTVIPFRAWSYLYPTGILTAGFAHSSSSHLVGNLVGTLALAPIAEFAWGHYSGGSRRSSEADSTGGSPSDVDGSDEWRARLRELQETPRVRAFVLFPLAALVLGLFTAVFALGPVIGFSGVVFAFGGFALVRYPIGTLVALLLSSVLSTTYYAAQYPIVHGEISGSAPSAPWWASIAVQGHALGILLGVVLGLALAHRRNRRLDAGRVLLAMVVYGMTRNLWAIYWYEGNGNYVLYRGLGVSLVVVLGVIVALAASASDRPIPEAVADLPRSPTVNQVAGAWLAVLGVLVVAIVAAAVAFAWPLLAVAAVAVGGALVLALPAIWTLSPIELDEVPSGRQAAFGALIAVLLLVAVPAMLPNLVTVGHDPVPNDQALAVEGYSVTYAEDTRDRMIPAIDLPAVRNRTTVRTSGVIVVNEERSIWTNALSKQYLASEGDGAVTVGGVGWRETIHADRVGWSLTGNDTVYAVDLSHDGETIRAFTSQPRRATPTVSNHTVVIVPTREEFQLRVFRDGEQLGTAIVPSVGNATSVGELTLRTERIDDRATIVASANGTRVPIAQRETYREE